MSLLSAIILSFCIFCFIGGILLYFGNKSAEIDATTFFIERELRKIAEETGVKITYDSEESWYNFCKEIEKIAIELSKK